MRTSVKAMLRNTPREHYETANISLRDMIISDLRWDFVTKVCSYESFKTELPTSSLNLEVVRSGRGLFVPEVSPSRDINMIQKNNFHDERGLTFVIVPGLAFSPEGHRLGRGWGCYDRFIKYNREDPSIIFIGVGFKFQLFESIPYDDHDVPVHEVVVV